ncbi:MAG: hypothetical protein A3A33_03745 [Candidatus Yanofskybacteria bacterium RIFCSPLOWO2_01_FULL_49_25]|uniref:N-acetyltransferase domain-containing protein n=1 Tax=Candidatus Yanofskybacteria bacterium RIFCSPLOWO2_01_FULL_49_25 TaxID=1802701 RepID=A0A1F8GV43_9BACT|nr:MAG: hypothetical protein A3A33_03745 [Candidatus Yanofskybacteria bacterium RIFCSPLOWO2_01_FULL_49_25]
MITIDEYVSSDMQELQNLIAELHDAMMVFEPEIMMPGDVARKEYIPYLIEQTKEKNGKICFAKQKGKAIGLMAVRTEKDSDEAVQYAWVSDLVVISKERSKGIGAKLLAYADVYAQSNGLSYLKIGVLAVNKGARKLYFKTGFRNYADILIKKLEKGS